MPKNSKMCEFMGKGWPLREQLKIHAVHSPRRITSPCILISISTSKFCQQRSWTAARKVSWEKFRCTAFRGYLVLVVEEVRALAVNYGRHPTTRIEGWFVQNFYSHLYGCCDVTNLFTLTVPSLLFLRFEGFFGHFSFFRFSVRKANVSLPLSEPLLKKLNGRKSPAVVDVRSSVIFEVCFYFCPLCLFVEIFVDHVAI